MAGLTTHLLRRARGADAATREELFAELWRHTAAEVLRLACARSRGGDAEDVAAEFWLRFARQGWQAGAMEHGRDFWSWARRVIRNLVINRHRDAHAGKRGGGWAPLGGDALDDLPGACGGEARAEVDEEVQAFLGFLAGQPEERPGDNIDLIILAIRRFALGRTLAEIAPDLGWSVAKTQRRAAYLESLMAEYARDRGEADL